MNDPTLNALAKMLVPVNRPDLGEEEAYAVFKVIKSGWIAQGYQVELFEQAIAAAHGKRFGVACSSGTAALHLALLSFGFGSNDVIGMPVHTMAAVGNAAAYCGSRIRFLPGDELVGNLIFEKPFDLCAVDMMAVIVPHTYGIPCSIPPWLRDAFVVIEDCAEAPYATIGGKPVGSFGDAAILSFDSKKITTTGEGGMVLTDDEAAAKHMRSLRSHAFGVRNHFEHPELGYNYRMTDLQAAIGIVQHSRYAEMLLRRGDIADSYVEAFKSVSWMLPVWQGFPGEVAWVYPLQTKFRDQLRLHLAELGVETRSYFTPLHKLPHLAARAVKLDDEAQAWLQSQERMADRGMYLPLYSGMTDAELNYVISCVRSFQP